MSPLEDDWTPRDWCSWAPGHDMQSDGERYLSAATAGVFGEEAIRTAHRARTGEHRARVADMASVVAKIGRGGIG